jgi:hypothetical protein
MRSSTGRIARIGLVAVLAASVFAAAPSSVAPGRAGTEAIPDLAMAPITDVQIQFVNGRRMLRFTGMMVNIGKGHFELSGYRESTSDPMLMRQVIYETSSRSSPISRRIPTDAVAEFSGDGHDHWHVQEMMRYDLWGGDQLLRGAKIGFCFLDSDPWILSLEGAPASSYYRASWCGSDPDALSNRMGISIGWGDKYSWYLAYQWVDITGLPSGTYTLRAKVDPYKYFLEQREANQCAFVQVKITSTGVSVPSGGLECVNDWAGTRFADDIAWMFATGITTGCAPDLYCPSDSVTRGEMATFLTRAFDLPWTSQDFFTDDEGLAHEGAINRLAKSGITTGCSATRFCPERLVTRGQMATFLARALGLPPAAADHFNDDDGTAHEDSINRIYEAGITTGCSATRFCPGGLVTRAQMAAFLHRALGD